MGHQEKSIIAGLVSTLLMFIGYVYVTLMAYITNTMTAEHTGRNVLLLMCACAVGKFAAVAIAKRVLRSNPEDGEEDLLDERDRMIELNGLQASYATFTVGFVVTMLSIWLGLPVILALNLITSSLVIGEVVSSSIKLYQYRAGA